MLALSAAETEPLISFTLPSTPYSAQIARFYVRATLTYHDLGEFTEHAEMIISELAGNVIEHANAPSFTAWLLLLPGQDRVAVIVADPSPLPPVKGDPSDVAECGRGLLIVEALSVRWGWQWRHDEPGKAVYAILAAWT